jgi:RNA polymerase sigma factor (sigma-70 family)
MLPVKSFNDLIRRAQAGEPRAQEELLAVVRPYLEKLAEGIADPSHASKSVSDLVQDTLLRVWLKLPQFEGTNDDQQSWLMFRTWAGKIARRLHLNSRRDRKAQRRRPERPIVSLQAGPPQSPDNSERKGLDPPAPGPTASATLRQDEQARLVQAALDRLTDRTSRDVVRLHFFEGVSLRQIAERLDLTYDQVRYRFQTAMQSLESDLRELGPLQ